MVTPRRPHRGHRLGLPWAARKYLLGARSQLTADGGVRNGGIVRLRYLDLHLYGEKDWERYLRGLQREWGPLIRDKRRVWRERKAAARQRAREARRLRRAPAAVR
jgi:hypothetical protein